MTRRSYTAEQRAETLALYEEHGACETARRTGIPLKTVSSWAKRAGVQTDAPERTAQATEQARIRAEERRARLADRLLEIAELGTDQTKKILADAGPRDVVGVWTRAIHDHLLLSGQPTSRHETQTTDALDREIERLMDKISQ